jgi:hypothetical protein
MADDDFPTPDVDPLLQQRAQTALQQVPLSAGQTVVLARGPQVVAHRGDLKPTEAQDVAGHVADGWQHRGQTARIQFMLLPLLTDERLLYTLPLADGYFLTVVEGSDVPLSRVSGLARQLAALLERAGLKRYTSAL